MKDVNTHAQKFPVHLALLQSCDGGQMNRSERVRGPVQKKAAFAKLSDECSLLISESSCAPEMAYGNSGGIMENPISPQPLSNVIVCSPV